VANGLDGTYVYQHSSPPSSSPSSSSSSSLSAAPLPLVPRAFGTLGQSQVVGK